MKKESNPVSQVAEGSSPPPDFTQYKKLIKECLKLAKKGEGKTSPNPMVGAVIFDDNFNIVSKGYHQKYGESHAEVNAVKNAACSLKGLSIAVNLEPCSHYGKTPPCADLIIKEGFKRVIVGMVDPNPIVSGNGIKKLQEAGIEVVTGVLEKECKKLNEVFLKDQIHKKPFITIKTATTLDGKIACKTGSSKWITSEKSRNYVQKLRNSHDAILTSSNTVIIDNPSLTCRMKNGKNPIRIVIDSKLKADPKSNVYRDDQTPVFIVTDKNISEQKQKTYPNYVNFIKCKLKNGKIDLKDASQKLYEKNIKSILIEAGGTLNHAFVNEKLADKLIQFIAPKIIGDKDAISFIQGFDINKIEESQLLTELNIKSLKPDIMIESYFI